VKKQPIGRNRANNVICHLEGKSDFMFIVGAHYDRMGTGPGVADNWSGIVLISRLVEALQLMETNHTWEIIAFGEEETGTYGSKAYMRDHKGKPIISMINVDTLGLGPLKFDSRSSQGLKCIAEKIATDIEVQLSPSHLQETTGDWEPFDRRGIDFLSLHSLDRRLIRKLHTRRDSWKAISENRMQEAWRLLVSLSSLLDRQSEPRF
jgi:hypothetical protein|tara:strand:- start:903 stop:1523 length:621 start_codon:yes stop_codon:yes gene_type:complete